MAILRLFRNSGCTAIIIFMTLYEEHDLLREILFGVGGLITGLGAGFGLAETRRR